MSDTDKKTPMSFIPGVPLWAQILAGPGPVNVSYEPAPSAVLRQDEA